MNTNGQSNSGFRPLRKQTRHLQLAVACFVAIANIARSQTVLITPPAVPKEQLPPTQSVGETNQVDSTGGPVSSTASAATPNTNPFQWGPVTLHPSLSYHFTYGTGLQSSPGQANNSIIQTVSPGLGFDLGTHWHLGYTPAAVFYSDPKFRNNVDQNLSLTGHTAYQDWIFNLGQTIALTSDPLIATARQTDQQSYVTSFGATYQINGEISMDLTAVQNFSTASGYTNSVGDTRDWSVMDWFNYQWGPNFSTSLGAGFGYSQLSAPSPDMCYEDLQARLSWHFARKLTLSLNGGGQIRQFLNSGSGSLVSPTFGATFSYQPFSFTTIFVNANRGINPSLFQSQVSVNTSVSGGFSQRFLKKYFLSVNAGYTTTSYENSSSQAQSLRDDHQSFFSASLSTAFLKRANASVFYSVSKNSSSSLGFGYNSDQIGFTVSYAY